jgi:putative chromate ion transporter
LTFGGAYTAIPFIQAEVTVRATWMTQTQFLDGLALSSILPAPLVIFSTFVGYYGGSQLNAGIGGEFGGGILTTIGMFLPAFSFTLIGHEFFEQMVHNKVASAFLDGVTGAVIGLVAVTAFDLTRSSILSVSTDLVPSYDLFTPPMHCFNN